MTLDLDGDAGPDVAIAFIAAASASRHPIPFNVHEIAETLAGLADEMTNRGWRLRDIDAEGVSLSWPPSQLDDHDSQVESSITWVTLAGTHHAVYILAGHARGAEPGHLRWGTIPEFLGMLGHLETPA